MYRVKKCNEEASAGAAFWGVVPWLLLGAALCWLIALSQHVGNRRLDAESFSPGETVLIRPARNS